MKEIVEGIWNAPKADVFQFFHDMAVAWCIGLPIGLVGMYFLHKYIKEKMGFGKEWDKKWKDFDKKFENFN